MSRRTPLLIIDDEPGILEGLVEFLEDEGYEVHQASDGKAGLELFRSVTPNVVVADLRMEGMSGIEVIKEIRKINELVPIIIVTGYGSFGSALDAIRLDVFDYMEKPVDLNHFKATLDRARDSLRKTQQIQEEISRLREQVKQCRQQWIDQIARLSEAEALMETGRLLAGVLHNLSNPLTYIMGQAELLQVLYPDIENLSVIETQALRMRDIMATIMKKVSASQTRQPQWLQCNDILRDEVRFLESHPYFKTGIEKRWHLDDGLPLFKGTLADLSQIFGNILRNAVEAMKDSEVKTVVLKTWHDDEWINVSILDTGRGIELHHLERIFEPFFTTKASEVGLSGRAGMGIGLYHCRALVTQYGGHIDVESTPGRGTTFIVRLPMPREVCSTGGHNVTYH